LTSPVLKEQRESEDRDERRRRERHRERGKRPYTKKGERR
jgi:hypothetical protein